MSLRTRLRRLEERDCVREVSEAVEIWLPENGRGGPPPGRHGCPGSDAILVIYEPTAAPLPDQTQP